MFREGLVYLFLNNSICLILIYFILKIIIIPLYLISSTISRTNSSSEQTTSAEVKDINVVKQKTKSIVK